MAQQWPRKTQGKAYGEKNVNSPFDRLFLVTSHHGGMACIVYHGDDITLAKRALIYLAAKPSKKRLPGQTREFRKLWQLVDKQREEF